MVCETLSIDQSKNIYWLGSVKIKWVLWLGQIYWTYIIKIEIDNSLW